MGSTVSRNGFWRSVAFLVVVLLTTPRSDQLGFGPVIAAAASGRDARGRQTVTHGSRNNRIDAVEIKSANSTLPGSDERLFFDSAIRQARIVNETIDYQTQLTNVTVQFKTGPNPPKSEYYFKCVPKGQGCETAASNAAVSGPLPITPATVLATIVNLDFSPGMFYSCYIGAKIGKVTTCESVSSGKGPEGQYFYLGRNGVTVMCPDAGVGTKGYVNGVEYTKVDDQTLRSLAENPLLWNDLPTVCTSGITDMSYLFTDLPNPVDRMRPLPMTSFNTFDKDISSWDTSSVKTMSFMFSNANKFNQDIGLWDTSNVERMNGMFALAKSFNHSLSTWNTSAVTTMRKMFAGASAFNGDIGSWITSRVTDMSYMFDRASKFNQDIGNWDTSRVSFMDYMFNYAFSFDQNINRWDVHNVVDMNHMFTAANRFNQDLNSWDTSKVENMNAMFAYTDVFNGNVATWNVSKVRSMVQMFNYAPVFNSDISQWNMANVVQMSWMFFGAVEFNKDVSSWETGATTSMEGMFMDASIFNQDLRNWDVMRVSGCQDFAENSALNVTYYPRFNCALGYCPTGKTFSKRSPTILYSKMDSAIITGTTASIDVQNTDQTNYCSPF